MDELNLYQGAFSGRMVDRLLTKVYQTPGSGAIPFVWRVPITVLLIGTAGSEYSGEIRYQSPSGAWYQAVPNFDYCQIVDVEVTNPQLIDKVSISITGSLALSYSVRFRESGRADVFVWLVEKPGSAV